ncbi:hypothetical protein KFK09_011555 [Dendrobium nobile]|uniref:HAT C-terminal dimerisation domain-containing protein n=1 Tax=Dendrobium nobile TaxID=94219 RepID=A0A8T3BEX6_DENNO|nr:hypothetical protein KFK09_011555 [Dendrobium nobile]
MNPKAITVSKAGNEAEVVSAGNVQASVRSEEQYMLGTAQYMLGTAQYMLGTARYSSVPSQHRSVPRKYMLGTERYMLGTTRYTLGTEQYMLGTERYMLGTKQYMLGTELYMLGTERYMLGTERYMLGTELYMLGIERYNKQVEPRQGAAPPWTPGRLKRIVRWWSQFGDDVPELKAFAVKVLSLTCSASVCERNWSIFNQIHTKRRNRLTTYRMNKLVYVMFNKKLKDRHLKLQKQGSIDNEIDPLLVDDLQSDDEWGTPKNVDVSEVEVEGETQVNENSEATTHVYKRKKQSEIGASKKFKGILKYNELFFYAIIVSF